MTKSKKKNLKVRDLKPKKDAKGGGAVTGQANTGQVNTGQVNTGQTNTSTSLNKNYSTNTLN